MGNLKTLLAPISTANPVGDNLYYDALYDQIKEARREDDPSLSQGVWEIALKKADWPAVENLSSRALITQTKDLQIASWLVESWVAMDQLEGIIKGIDLIQGLSTAYWDQIYPQILEEDNERRTHLFEWLDTTLTNRLVMLPLFKNPLNATHMSLADWMQATRLETVSKRSPNRQKMLQKAEQQQELTLEKIHQILNTCPKQLLENLNISVVQALELYEDFKQLLDTLFKDGSRPVMNDLPDALKELLRFIKVGLDLMAGEIEIIPEAPFLPPPPPLEPSATSEIITGLLTSPPQTRAQAYKLINDIGDFLQTVEPHSPAPALLKRIATWENKNISDIFKDFGNTPEDWTTLAKFIGAGSPNSKT